MRRQICWTERLDDGVKREVRVTFHGPSFKWQSKRTDQEKWDYDTPPNAADWATLLTHAENWYQRHRLPREHLERLCRARRDAGFQPD